MARTGKSFCAVFWSQNSKKKILKNKPLDDVHFSYIKILKKKKEKN
jgi:hypothetical protein